MYKNSIVYPWRFGLFPISGWNVILNIFVHHLGGIHKCFRVVCREGTCREVGCARVQLWQVMPTICAGVCIYTLTSSGVRALHHQHLVFGTL